jgi:hypothetical protein
VLLGRGELGSTTDLVFGDAGRLVRMLRGFASRTEMAAAVALSEDQAAEPAAGKDLAAAGVRLVDVLVSLVPAVVASWECWRSRRAPTGEAGAARGTV